MKEILDNRNPDKNYPEKEYNKLIREELDAPWLCPRGRQLKELLDICDNQNQKDLIFFLIRNFNFFDSIKIEEALQNIYKYIQDEFKLSAQDTVISTVSRDSFDMDSSQSFLADLRNVINADWKKRLITNIDNFKELLSKDSTISNIIFIDDFVGTGEKIEKFIKKIKNIFPKHNYYFCTIASMKQSKNILDSMNIHYFSHQWLDKGISDYFIGQQLTESILTMTELEKKLNDLDNIYHFGYKKSETLYSYGYNTPNNTFPIFWSRNNDENRKPIFTNRLTKSEIPTPKEKIYKEYPDSKDKEILDTIAKNPTDCFHFREKFKLSPENVVESILKYKKMGIFMLQNNMLSITEKGKKWLLKNRYAIYSNNLSMINKAIVNFNRDSEDYSLSPSKLSILKKEKGN